MNLNAIAVDVIRSQELLKEHLSSDINAPQTPSKALKKPKVNLPYRAIHTKQLASDDEDNDEEYAFE